MLTLIPTPIGNIYDISLRALVAIKSAKILLCEDTRVAKKLLELLYERGLLESSFLAKAFLDSAPDFATQSTLESSQSVKDFINAKQFLPFHSHNENDVIATLDSAFFEDDIVLLSDAGMPCISDPGAKLVQYCIAHNIAFDILPGPSALNVAYCAAGAESSQFVFAGFLPHKIKDKEFKILELSALNLSQYCVICYESTHRIIETLELLAKILPRTPISAQKELTKLHQMRYYGTSQSVYENIKNANIKGEWVLTLHFLNTAKAQSLSYNEALQLDIEPKAKAKVLAKISGKSIKACYEMLIKQNLARF